MLPKIFLSFHIFIKCRVCPSLTWSASIIRTNISLLYNKGEILGFICPVLDWRWFSYYSLTGYYIEQFLLGEEDTSAETLSPPKKYGSCCFCSRSSVIVRHFPKNQASTVSQESQVFHLLIYLYCLRYPKYPKYLRISFYSFKIFKIH